MSNDEACSRRRVLGVIGTGLAATLAGCGYQPAAGDLDWRTDVVRLLFSPGGSGQWLADGEFVYNVRDSGWVAAYDERGDAVWIGSPDGDHDRDRDGGVAVADGRVYLSTEDAHVVALEREPNAESDTETETSGRRRGRPDASTRWVSSIDRRDDDRDGAENGTDSDGGDGSNGSDGGDGSNGSDGGDDSNDSDSGDSNEDVRYRLAADSGLVVAARDVLVAFDADDGEQRYVLGTDGDEFDGEWIEDVSIADGGVWAIGVEDVDRTAAPEPEPTLYGIAADGDVRTTLSLPAVPDWFETVGSDCVLGFDGELWVIDEDGDRRGTLELAGDIDSTAVVVEDQHRLYHYSRTALEAIDIAAVERAWRREIDRFYHAPVADTDGVYAVAGDPTTVDGCSLTAFASDGDRRWDVRPPTELGCGDACFVVGDRFVVRDGDQLYGFRTDPGRRRTVREWIE